MTYYFKEKYQEGIQNVKSLQSAYNLLKKKKCSVSNKETMVKIKIISLLPSSWICEKITDKFEVSDDLDRLSRNLVMEQEILP